MKRILISTNHPAPYFDKMCFEIEKLACVDVIYKKRKDTKKTWKDFTGKEGVFYDQLSFWKFLNIYRSHDLAILGGWDNVYCFLTILLNFLFKTKCCVFSDHPQHTINKGLNYFIKKYFLFRSIDYLFCATQSTCEFYQKNYGVPSSKTVFFPYTFDDNFSPEIESSNRERENELSNGSKIRIFIANNFMYRKGYSSIVEAFSIMSKNNSLNRFKIKIAGNGECFDETKTSLDGLNEDIEFLGWVEPDQYSHLINNCDIYIHASLFEPFGIPPLDAMCRQKLLVASNGVESVSSLLTTGVDGFLFSAGDGKELAHILENIDVNNLYTIARKGRETLLSTYNKTVYQEAIEYCFK